MNSKPNPPSSNPFANYETKNPFVDAMPAKADVFAPPEPEGETWGPYAHIESLDDGEERFGEERALEVMVTWGQTVLHVAHLSPPRPFTIGDETDGSGDKVDFHLPEDVLGRKRLPLVLLQEGEIKLVVPDIARGQIRIEKRDHDLQATLASSPPCPSVTRAKEVTIDENSRTTLEIGNFKFLVRLVTPSAPIERGLLANFDWAVPTYFGMTAATFGGLIAALSYFVPPLGLQDESAIDKDRFLAISHYLDAASEREQLKEDTPSEQQGGEESGQAAERAPGEAGTAGKEESTQKNKRVAVKGPIQNPQMQLSRPEAMKLAQEFGMIGILNGGIAADPNAPRSIFGRDVTLGNDDLSANGNLWASEIGEAIGNGGLSVFGPGPGGGFGDGTGIGLSRIGGDLLGTGHGEKGMGRGSAVQFGTHVAKAPGGVRTATPTVGGRIPPQVVQRIVRQNFGRFRLCYQQGLARNPSLEGRIPVRFTIGRDGAVSSVSALGGFPDSQVQSCVQSAFYGLSFPPPDDGVVQVTYPILFSPS